MALVLVVMVEPVTMVLMVVVMAEPVGCALLLLALCCVTDDEGCSTRTSVGEVRFEEVEAMDQSV
jgi:hypothetical protein